MGKWLERMFGRKEMSYEDVARKLALGDEKVNGFIDSLKDGYSLSVSGVGKKQVVEYLAETHHPELAPYADSPERLLCVLVDSRQSGVIGVPERDVMRVYVDVKEKKVVAKDILKWDNGSGSGPACIIDKV